MKTILVASMLLLSYCSYSQVSLELGMLTRMTGTAKAAIEVPLNQFNIELGTMVSLDNLNPIFGLQTGYSFIVDRYNQELRLAVGAYYHFGMLLPDKELKVSKFMFGGSARFKWSVGVFVSGEWNGEAGKLGIGYLFNQNCK